MRPRLRLVYNTITISLYYYMYSTAPVRCRACSRACGPACGERATPLTRRNSNPHKAQQQPSQGATATLTRRNSNPHKAQQQPSQGATATVAWCCVYTVRHPSGVGLVAEHAAPLAARIYHYYNIIVLLHVHIITYTLRHPSGVGVVVEHAAPLAARPALPALRQPVRPHRLRLPVRLPGTFYIYIYIITIVTIAYQ